MENNEFPILCETCLGSSGFVRMIKDNMGGTCKMCERPYTIFKWRPKGEAYKKTEVCQLCSKLKNICQTCILDLEYGLPSQLRDAVLAEFEGKSTATQSEVNRDHQMQQQIVALSNGEDMWATRDNPNERLLRMARTVIHDREQSRIKLPPPPTSSTAKSSIANSDLSAADNLKRSHSHAFTSHEGDPEDHLLLPPGIASIEELQRFNLPQRVQSKVDVGSNSTVGIESGTGINNSSVSSGSSYSIDTMSVQTIKTAKSSSSSSINGGVHHSIGMDAAVAVAVVTVKPKPPKPTGPPPASAFRKPSSSMPISS